MLKCRYGKFDKDMKYIKYIKILLPIITLFFIGNYSSAINTKDIASYVYPNNLHNSPRNMQYMADGLSYLCVSDDNHFIIITNT